MTRPGTGLLSRACTGLVEFTLRRPWTVLALTFALAVVSVIYTKLRLEFRTGQDDLVSSENRDSRNYLRYLTEFPDLDSLIIVVRAEPGVSRAERFADILAARLEQDRTNVKSVLHKMDIELFAGRALLYMSSEEIDQLAGRLSGHKELLHRYAAEPTLANFFKLINQESSRAFAQHLAV